MCTCTLCASLADVETERRQGLANAGVTEPALVEGNVITVTQGFISGWVTGLIIGRAMGADVVSKLCPEHFKVLKEHIAFVTKHPLYASFPPEIKKAMFFGLQSVK